MAGGGVVAVAALGRVAAVLVVPLVVLVGGVVGGVRSAGSPFAATHCCIDVNAGRGLLSSLSSPNAPILESSLSVYQNNAATHGSAYASVR